MWKAEITLEGLNQNAIWRNLNFSPFRFGSLPSSYVTSKKLRYCSQFILSFLSDRSHISYDVTDEESGRCFIYNIKRTETLQYGFIPSSLFFGNLNFILYCLSSPCPSSAYAFCQIFSLSEVAAIFFFQTSFRCSVFVYVQWNITLYCM